MKKTSATAAIIIFILSAIAGTAGPADEREAYVELISIKIDFVRKLNVMKEEVAKALSKKDAEIAELKKAVEEKERKLIEAQEENEIFKKEVQKIIKENENAEKKRTEENIAVSLAIYELSKDVTQIVREAEKFEVTQ